MPKNATSSEIFNATVNESANLRMAMSGIDRNLTIDKLAEPIVTNENPLILNEFITVLFNKFIKSEVITGLYKNPLAPIKRGDVRPYGDTIERMIFNPAKAMEYEVSHETDNILTPKKPDVKVEYIRVTRKDKYAVSLARELIMQAFSSDESFGNFIDGAINSLYNGDTIDEFLLMKKIVSDMTEGGFVQSVASDTTQTGFTKQLINYAKWFRFPSDKFNGYSAKYPDDKLITWVDPENIVIIARSDKMTDVKVDVLAAAFNLSEIELSSNIIEVDSFDTINTGTDEEPVNKEIDAIICDRSFFQVADTLTQFADFYRADYLATKSYWHHWQTMTCSLFANAIVLTSDVTD